MIRHNIRKRLGEDRPWDTRICRTERAGDRGRHCSTMHGEPMRRHWALETHTQHDTCRAHGWSIASLATAHVAKCTCGVRPGKAVGDGRHLSHKRLRGHEDDLQIMPAFSAGSGSFRVPRTMYAAARPEFVTASRMRRAVRLAVRRQSDTCCCCRSRQHACKGRMQRLT